MHMSRHGARILTCLLLVAVLCVTSVVASHTHLGGSFRPGCPACQLERTVGTSSAAVTVAPMVVAPAVIGLVTDLPPFAAPRHAAVLQSSPRSPPFPC